MRNYLKKTYMGIASLLALMSCSDGNEIHTYTVGAEDNAIALSIGVDNSPLTPTPNLAKQEQPKEIITLPWLKAL